MASPFYKIFIRDTEEELTFNVSNFSFTRSVDRDDILSFNVSFQDFSQVPEQFLVAGTELEFYYGYLGGKQSAKRLARVTARTRNYSSDLKFTIKATDLGLLAKKGERYDDWSGSSTEEIVKAIAQRNGMNPIIDNTDTSSFDTMPQGGRSDFEMVKYLSSIQKKGTYRFFVTGNDLFFTKRVLESNSEFLIDYTDKSIGFVSLNISDVDNTKSEASRSVVSRSIDENTGEVIERENNGGEKKLGKYKASPSSQTVVLDGNSRVVAVTGRSPSKATKSDSSKKGKTVLGVVPKSEELQSVSDNIANKKSLSDIKARLTMQGNPELEIDTIITLNGFSDEDNGNWYINEIKESLSSGYLQTFTLSRNATNLNTEVSGNDAIEDRKINKTVGGEETSNTKVVRQVVLDANARIVN